MVHRRPLHVWQRLLEVVGVQQACHLGEPDYDNFHAYARGKAAMLRRQQLASSLLTPGGCAMRRWCCGAIEVVILKTDLVQLAFKWIWYADRL